MQRYLTLKDMTPEQRKKVNPKVVFFAGKAAPGCEFDCKHHVCPY